MNIFRPKVYQFRNNHLLSALRSHTTRGIKGNFSFWYKEDTLCPLSKSRQCQGEDTQQHLLTCQALVAGLSPEELQKKGITSYLDIYGSFKKQMMAVKVFSCLIDIQEKFLQAAPPSSGSTLDATSLQA